MSSKQVIELEEGCGVCEELWQLMEQHRAAAHASLAAEARAEEMREDSSSMPNEPAAERTLDHVERLHIGRIIQETNNNLSQAARILGIDRSTLYSKVKKYGLR